MPILKYNARVGSKFDNFVHELERLAIEIQKKENLEKDYNFYLDVFYSLPSSEQEKVTMPDWSYTQNKPLCILTGRVMFIDFLSQIEDNFEIYSEFNGCLLVVKGNSKSVTTAEELIQQKREFDDKKRKEYEDWLLSTEGLEYTNNQKLLAEQQVKNGIEFDKKFNSVSISFVEGGKNIWKSYLKKNPNGYGKGILKFSKLWAFYMEQQMENELTKEIVDSACKKADVEGITGFMYGAAVSTLSTVWKYGEQLRVLHNKDYNIETEGVVNSAVLTITY